jgi:hypothetical protein
MSRLELIAQVKSLNVQTAKPAHMMKTEDLQALVDKYIKGAEVKEITMKSRILELSKDGKTTKEIKVLLEEEGWASKMKCGKIRPIYINLVVKNN